MTKRKETTMEIDFDSADRVSDYVTVPQGTYLCRVAEVRPGATRAGDERWSLRLVVAEGPHVGKQAAWDSLVFSTRGRARARIVLAALGLPAKGKVNLQPGELEGRQAFVQIRPSEYASPGGDLVRRNEVPYEGYRAAEGQNRHAGSLSDSHVDSGGDSGGFDKGAEAQLSSNSNLGHSSLGHSNLGHSSLGHSNLGHSNGGGGSDDHPSAGAKKASRRERQSPPLADEIPF
ncbi:MAG: hypothetical protein EXS02_07385 [Planctomycetes bacterium]|nr:hypothetical protein [Planctomycetota bacterium]